MAHTRKNQGFTIVELLIVIVVIGILAAITLVAYNGIQARAHNTQRQSDINAIAKALEAYYIDEGAYPAGSGSTMINAHWSNTSDASWNNLKNALVPKYMSSLPVDPKATSGADFRQNVNGWGMPTTLILVITAVSRADRCTFWCIGWRGIVKIILLATARQTGSLTQVATIGSLSNQVTYASCARLANHLIYWYN